MNWHEQVSPYIITNKVGCSFVSTIFRKIFSRLNLRVLKLLFVELDQNPKWNILDRCRLLKKAAI